MFIVITGLDGSGTSTVANKLKEIDADSTIFRTPSIEYSARESIDTTVRETSQIAHYLFYLSSVAYLSDKIRREYDYKNKNIYCVRYLIDTIVSHQVAGLDVDLDYSQYNILEPDLTIFVSINEDVRERRIKKRGESILDKLLDNSTIRNKFVEKFQALLDKKKTIYFDNTSTDINGNIAKLYEEIRKRRQQL